ncbi:transcriptional regulator [Kitasatospora sp. NPDC101183]|uniref:transcriptional regulator n=1 Tax=Kitasatospora sp. NPDC101183 TaxID=3364100 RepID=UPI00382208E9
MSQAAAERAAGVEIPISSLVLGGSPRTEGSDAEHIALLAGLEGPLPPILVERSTMRVIDGTHRVLAAAGKGERSIEAEFFDGTADEAFLKAVEANVAHGLPLSQADRRTAAERIVASHPHMSDRAIARSAGLGAKTVAAIRCRVAEQPQLRARVGRDGKVRPLDSGAGRRRAAEVLAERPEASLREVARLAGISPATVSDVRRRIAAGEPPVAGGARDAGAGTVPPARHPRGRAARRVRLVHSDPAAVLQKLLRDPALRHKEEGRELLRLLRQNAIGSQERSELTAAVPAHCGALVVDLARWCAESWLEFAQELDSRLQDPGAGPVDPHSLPSVPPGALAADGRVGRS